MSIPLVEGSKAPAFSIETTDGKKQLSSYKGKYLVLYFYPKDDTPGCTNEAKDFSALASDFATAGAEILGVSRDTLAKHGKFADKHDLNIPLGADEDGGVCEAYGTWVEKNMYGRTYMGIARSTFLIGSDGRIKRIWPKVRVKGHAQQVLDCVSS
ncbi:MAG: peroxiredoxin [Alphaproteobacteria bacterium]|nr:peroxiredoxin [Alphaproteobacteria bacterium]MBU2083300.1 peroxiredoxin [Alphaproteobacteria bacterium]MBU2143735.1 peroxiredoxin [Alphaproteobacteria bacterium]MBU2195584.1 peroxiredoxin [Alphaproteobacteria bacterium]